MPRLTMHIAVAKQYIQKHESKIIDFIEEISSISIENEVEIIKQKGMEGLK